MSNGPIPAQLDPRRLADRGMRLEGDIPLTKLERVSQITADTTGFVHVVLLFERDEQKQVVVQLELEAELAMICQRCLEQAKVKVSESYRYVVINPNPAVDIQPSGYDILEVGEHPLDVYELIEDELLLALPVVPMHSPGECQHPPGYVEQAAAEEKDNPFSVLAQLKRD